MKRIFKKSMLYLLIVTLLCSAIFIPVSADDTAVGQTYTPTSDWKADEEGNYHISSGEDLAAFYKALVDTTSFSGFSKKTVYLDQDIDLNPGWVATSGEQPTYIFELISDWSFKGTFDGQGHSISGYYAIPDTTKVKFIGFFPQANGATIQNFSLLNSFIGSPGIASVTTNAFAIGSIVGVVRGNTANIETTFKNLYIDTVVGSTNPTDVTKQLSCVGGICGQLFDGAAEFKSCVFAGCVSGHNYVGGILGTNVQGANNSYKTNRVDMTDCAVYGTVRADIISNDSKLLQGQGKAAGGFIGKEGGTAVLTRCLSFGTLKAATTNQYSGAFAYLDSVSETADKAITFRLTDCYTYEGAASNGCAVGLHSSRLTFDYHIQYCKIGSDWTVNTHYDQTDLTADVAENGTQDIMKTSVQKLSSNTVSALLGIQEYNDWCGVGDRLLPKTVATMRGFQAYAVTGIHSQMGTDAADGKTSMRFVAVIDDIELTDYAQIGFEVCISDGTNSVTKTLRGNCVYTSVMAAGETVTAEALGGKYVFALEILNIPASGTYTFTVRPVTVDAKGTALTGTAGVTKVESGTIATA